MKKVGVRIIVAILRMVFWRNAFVRALIGYLQTRGEANSVIVRIVYSYRKQVDEINRYLYSCLTETDQLLFVRFFLKRFCGIDTIDASEEKVIDEAFKTVETLYKEQNPMQDYIEIPFRGSWIKYVNEKRDYIVTNDEERLMCFYEVTHAFFLVEYEEDGFNPKDGETILDCGAANGDTALLFGMLYPNSQICSFEFGDEQFRKLERNIEMNSLKSRVQLVNAYLYMSSGEMYVDDDYEVIDAQKGNMEWGRKVQALSIDDYVSNNRITNIGLIKFDIEGGELSALKGAIKTIQQFKPILYIPIYHKKSDVYEIPRFLHTLGIPIKYKLKWTEKKVWGVDCVLFVKFND